MSSKSYKFKKFQDTSNDNYIFPHKHCKCGKMIAPTEEYCSDACRGNVENKSKKNKKRMYKTIGIFAIISVVFIIVVLLITHTI